MAWICEAARQTLNRWTEMLQDPSTRHRLINCVLRAPALLAADAWYRGFGNESIYGQLARVCCVNIGLSGDSMSFLSYFGVHLRPCLYPVSMFLLASFSLRTVYRSVGLVVLAQSTYTVAQFYLDDSTPEIAAYFHLIIQLLVFASSQGHFSAEVGLKDVLRNLALVSAHLLVSVTCVCGFGAEIFRQCLETFLSWSASKWYMSPVIAFPQKACVTVFAMFIFNPKLRPNSSFVISWSCLMTAYMYLSVNSQSQPDAPTFVETFWRSLEEASSTPFGFIGLSVTSAIAFKQLPKLSHMWLNWTTNLPRVFFVNGDEEFIAMLGFSMHSFGLLPTRSNVFVAFLANFTVSLATRITEELQKSLSEWHWSSFSARCRIVAMCCALILASSCVVYVAYNVSRQTDWSFVIGVLCIIKSFDTIFAASSLLAKCVVYGVDDVTSGSYFEDVEALVQLIGLSVEAFRILDATSLLVFSASAAFLTNHLFASLVHFLAVLVANPEIPRDFRQFLLSVRIWRRATVVSMSTPPVEQPRYHDDNCSICFDEFLQRREICVTSCGHLFHRRCVVTWLNVHSICPKCRTDVRRLTAVKRIRTN